MSNTINLPAWANELEHRAEVFPHQLDLIKDNLLLVELSAAEVSEASFLDQRVLKQGTNGTWVPWQFIAEMFEKVEVKKPPNFIFHVGHCGSTLVSRLLQQMDKTTSLREPLPLRTLAQDVADAQEGRSFLSPQEQAERLQVLSKMWCRGAGQAVVKATSICTDLLPIIHGDDSVAKSMFVYNRAETHIATLLAGENAVVDLRGFAQLRLHQMSVGQLAALSWLSETLSATRSLEQYPDQVTVLEFEAFLREPADSLARISSFLDIDADSEAIEKAVNSDVLQTYSKAPEHRYNAQTRSAILADSRARFAKEIDEALTWLDELAGRSELVSASLQKFA